jgi:hypothetical protein
VRGARWAAAARRGAGVVAEQSGCERARGWLQAAQARGGASPGGHRRARLGRRWSGAGGAGLEQAWEPARVLALERRSKAGAHGSNNGLEEE